MNEFAEIAAALAARRAVYARADLRLRRAVDRARAHFHTRHAELLAELKVAAAIEPPDIGAMALVYARIAALNVDAERFSRRVRMVAGRIAAADARAATEGPIFTRLAAVAADLSTTLH